MSAEIESLSTDANARRPGRGPSPMLVGLAILALLLAAYATWRISRFEDRYDRIGQQFVELRGTQNRLDARLQALSLDLESSRTAWRAELRDLRELPGQVDELGQNVDELRSRADSPQRAWVRAEALYLMELAERRLELDRDLQTALVAMEAADARLSNDADPAMREVRSALDAEIAALRGVRLPDVAQVQARIGRLEDAVPTLPVVGMPVEEVRRVRRDREEQGPFARAGQRLRLALRDIVSLRRIEPSTARLVTQEEDSLRRQHLELLLLSARIAAMRPDGAAYRQSLRAAGAWIEQYFDTSHPEVGVALAEIAALEAVHIDPELPGVGEAGRTLRALMRSGPPVP
jgi:uroporphyrin-3 C-methyltransferase